MVKHAYEQHKTWKIIPTNIYHVVGTNVPLTAYDQMNLYIIYIYVYMIINIYILSTKHMFVVFWKDKTPPDPQAIPSQYHQYHSARSSRHLLQVQSMTGLRIDFLLGRIGVIRMEETRGFNIWVFPKIGVPLPQNVYNGKPY